MERQVAIGAPRTSLLLDRLKAALNSWSNPSGAQSEAEVARSATALIQRPRSHLCLRAHRLRVLVTTISPSAAGDGRRPSTLLRARRLGSWGWVRSKTIARCLAAFEMWLVAVRRFAGADLSHTHQKGDPHAARGVSRRCHGCRAGDRQSAL